MSNLVIYKATNLINGKTYIGQTTLGLASRIKSHYHAARYNKSNKSPFILSIRKYGEETYQWEELQVCSSIEELNLAEEHWIKSLGSHIDTGKGYNVMYGGSNKKHCQATKQKISESQKGALNHMYGKKGKDNPTSKPLVNLLTGEHFDSVTIASSRTSISVSKIAAVCRGDRFSAGSQMGANMCIFRYTKDGAPIPVTLKSTGRGNRYSINNKILTWGRAEALARHYNVTHAFIAKVTKGTPVTDVYGNTWKVIRDARELENMLISVPSKDIIAL